MAYTITQFDSKVFRRAESEDDFNLYKAALEWSLIDPIVIEDRDDIKSEYRWRDLVSPYNHQVTNLITFCRRLPVTLLADDVGLGKTISAGLIASELISRGRLTKILIVCPKILREQWKEELETKFNIPSIIVTGQELIKAKPPGDAGAVITTYNTARLHLEKIGKIGYEMLILDEAHKLRNLYGVDPTPQVATTFHKALANRLFKYVLMLTATPIQNRLWDLYSLVDLLTVARGHKNPFGTDGAFARKFIADARNQARQLRPEVKDEFRNIVYGYMSRMRRGDANLHFPDRVVQLHSVDPTPEELELIQTIAKPIQELSFFAQIIILQALISSPEAVVKVLEGMGVKGTAPKSLGVEAKKVASRIKMTAKLSGLSALIKKLRQEKPDDWRVVIFTRWRETQTTIQQFLEKNEITCGLINGDSASRNQETIARFKKEQPDIHVIVSTEAGAEGVNLQAANVLVNYDLPWNPMIVEQRIGRIQRLSSNFEKVSIFNIVLKGTFEEYIVGRLMEKLQMASHAIGDIEALLEASGVDDDENGSGSFEEKIRQLVVASLSGKDVEKATLKAENSIKEAKLQLENEEKNINSLLGKMDGSEYTGPKCPKLPENVRSMNIRDFTLNALKAQGAKLSKKDGYNIAIYDQQKEIVRFTDDNINSDLVSVLYASGTSPFERLVSSIADKDLHLVDDLDENIKDSTKKISEHWLQDFKGEAVDTKVFESWRCYDGTALVRVRANVSCDSYERLVEIDCDSKDHQLNIGENGLDPLKNLIDKPETIGINTQILKEKALSDEGIAEFCRFYTERRAHELTAVEGDERKKKKIEDDFTPRLEVSVVGLKGRVYRKLKVDVTYKIDSDNEYHSPITITPHDETVNESPVLQKCKKSGRLVPDTCLEKCEISGKHVMRHLLEKSEISNRMALPEYIVVCHLSGKRVLNDEVEKSSVSGKLVAKSLLKTSPISGKSAEPAFFEKCEFTGAEVLQSELEVSQVSGKKYRADEQLKSKVSGKVGHKQEFIYCAETNVPLLPTEAETCEVTGKVVVPGLLEKCEVTNKMVLPDLLEKSALSGKKALKKYFIQSSLSGTLILETEAIKSSGGSFCTPQEARNCSWSGKLCHPDDLRTCGLTGIEIEAQYTTHDQNPRLGPLVLMLDAVSRKADLTKEWLLIADSLSKAIGGGRCTVDSATLSPDKKSIAVCAEVRRWAGLQTRYAGFVFALSEKAIIGRVVQGRRLTDGWTES